MLVGKTVGVRSRTGNIVDLLTCKEYQCLKIKKKIRLQKAELFLISWIKAIQYFGIISIYTRDQDDLSFISNKCR